MEDLECRVRSQGNYAGNGVSEGERHGHVSDWYCGGFLEAVVMIRQELRRLRVITETRVMTIVETECEGLRDEQGMKIR